MKEDEILCAVQECRSGKKESFTPIVAFFQEKIYRFCFHLLGSDDDAHEAASEVFMRTYLSLNSYDTNQQFSSWIFRIAYNHCIDIIRKRKKEREWLHEAARIVRRSHRSEPYTDDTLTAALQRKKLRKALGQLHSTYFTSLVLRYHFDLSYKEISRITDTPLSSVRVHIFRAKQELRKILEKEHSNEVFQ